MSIYLSIYLPTYLPTSLPTYLPTYLPIYPSIYIYIYMYRTTGTFLGIACANVQGFWHCTPAVSFSCKGLVSRLGSRLFRASKRGAIGFYSPWVGKPVSPNSGIPDELRKPHNSEALSYSLKPPIKPQPLDPKAGCETEPSTRHFNLSLRTLSPKGLNPSQP